MSPIYLPNDSALLVAGGMWQSVHFTPDFSIRLPLKSATCLLWQISHFVLTETAARLWGS